MFGGHPVRKLLASPSLGLGFTLGNLIRNHSAAVYEGHFKKERCIVKFLSSDCEYRPLHIEGTITSLLKETGIVPQVLHQESNILHTEDKEEYTQVLVVEHVPGLTLDRLVGTSIKEARSICVQTIEGLSLIHSKGIAHNDLKLDNIIYDGQKVTFIDFGSSYGVSYWNNIQFYDFHHEHQGTSESFLLQSELLYPPPQCDLEDSITHPGSFSLQRELKSLINNCLVLLLSSAGDQEGATKMRTLAECDSLSTILREARRSLDQCK